ncbi:MAG: adenylate/guanylate cyclase domain-containing protein [Hyphomicrobiaceae bacterium]
MAHVGQYLERLRAFRSPITPALPLRVRRLVEAQEIESERLIGWVQLGVVVLFGILYAVAPRPSDAPMEALLREPVPLALMAYLAFTIGRLVLAYRGALPGVVLLASILADVALLIGLIWSFHDQYGQAPAFSLKVPTFVYLFVFIAVRVLRFDARYVLAAGLAAALGWMGLVLAVLETSAPGVITRSFAEHLNQSRVLLGAEIDKVATLLMVTMVLGLAVVRGRRLFVEAIRNEAAVADLRRFFGQGVPDTVTGAEVEANAGLAHEREAAILMLDIRGFTALSAHLSPQRMVEVITRLHARVVPIVREHNGIIDKFMGDGIMVTFGAVHPTERPAADALAALEDVLDAGQVWQAEMASEHAGEGLSVNGAVTAGPVVFAVVGAQDRLEYTVIGEAVNLAAKLEKHNKVELTRGLTTARTLALARVQGYRPKGKLETRPARAVAGTAEPVDLVVIG